MNLFSKLIDHSRPFWFLYAFASWPYQLRKLLPRLGPSKANKPDLFADFRKSPHRIPASPSLFEGHGRAKAATECYYSAQLPRNKIRK